jgi:hypothetical protein
MTRLLIFLLIFSIVCSCTSSDKQRVGQLTQDFQTLDTIVPFSGFWVNELYINNIKKNKSPRLSQGVDKSCITIPDKTLQVTRMVAGFHEGAADMIVVKKNGNFYFYYKYNDTIRNPAYNIQIVSKEKIKIDNNTFIKTDEKFLEDILFSGKYLDSLGAEVQFTKDGHVNGLDSFKLYDPIYDYVDVGMDVDQVGLKTNRGKFNYYAFKFKQDTLLIYDLKCLTYDSTNKSCLVVDFGDLKYKLSKIH